MIVTKQFSLTPWQYFKIISAQRWKKAWWLYIAMLLVGIYFIKDFGKDDLATFLSVFAIFYPCFSFIYLYFWVNSEKNKVIFLDRKFEITSDKLTAIVENNVRNEVPIKFIRTKVETDEYWMLYISKNQFIYLPKNAFQSKEDLNTFKEILTPN